MRTGVTGSGVLVKEKEIFFPGYKVIYFYPDAIAKQSSFIILCHCDSKHAFRGRLFALSLSNSNRRPFSFNKTPLNGNCTTLYLLHNNSADQSSCSMDHLMSYFHPWCLFPDHREIVKRICVISNLTTWISSFIFLLHLK